VYRHTQTSGEQAGKYRRTAIYGVGPFSAVGVLALALGSFAAGALCILVALGSWALLWYLYRTYGSLDVWVDDEALRVSFAAGRTYRIPLSSIAGCTVTPLPFAVTAFWGRSFQTQYVGVWSPFTRQSALTLPRAFWIGGGEWVVIDLEDGRQVCVGSDEPYELATAIGRALASRPRDAGSEAGVTPVRPLSVV